MIDQEERARIKACHLEADELAGETGMDWFLAYQICRNRPIYENVPALSTGPDSVQQQAA